MRGPDLEQAREFLAALDEGAEHFCFRVIRRDGVARNFNGPLEQLAPILERENAAGAGVYVVVNEGGQDGASIRRVRAVFADNDTPGEPLAKVMGCGLEPHLAVETSPGKWHAYWFVDDLPLEQFSGVQLAIAQVFDTDANVHDLPRVMRLPGFLHTKGEPHPVRITHNAGTLPYKAGAVLERFPPVEAATRAPATPSVAADALETVTPEQVTELRSALASMRADDRAVWVDNGQRLKKLGEVGRGLWLEWSQTSDKYDPVDAARVWESFTADRTGYRAVFDAAQGAGWVNPASNAAKPTAKPKSEKTPAPKSAAHLLTQQFAPVQWAVRGILPEGVSILSGDPKIGKSWFLYQATVAVAAGKPLWPGREPETQGEALMLALEDNDRRLQRRLRALLPRFVTVNGRRFDQADITRLHYATKWPRAEEGVAQLATWLRAHPECRLVVIDTVSAFRQRDVAKNKSAYAADYEVGEMFKPLTQEFSCAIVLVMHNRKQHSEDALQLVSGTQGMTGGVDNVLVMQRKRGNLDAGLYVDGRDIEEPLDMALRFNDGFWSGTGQTVDQARMSDERRKVLEVVRELGPDAKAKAIADALFPKPYASVRSLLSKMVKGGDLHLAGGLYTHAGTVETVGTKDAA